MLYVAVVLILCLTICHSIGVELIDYLLLIYCINLLYFMLTVLLFSCVLKLPVLLFGYICVFVFYFVDI